MSGFSVGPATGKASEATRGLSRERRGRGSAKTSSRDSGNATKTRPELRLNVQRIQRGVLSRNQRFVNPGTAPITRNSPPEIRPRVKSGAELSRSGETVPAEHASIDCASASPSASMTSPTILANRGVVATTNHRCSESCPHVVQFKLAANPTGWPRNAATAPGPLHGRRRGHSAGDASRHPQKRGRGA